MKTIFAGIYAVMGRLSFELPAIDNAQNLAYLSTATGVNQLSDVFG